MRRLDAVRRCGSGPRDHHAGARRNAGEHDVTGCLQRFRDAHPRAELRIRTALGQEISMLSVAATRRSVRYGADPHIPEMRARSTSR
jgi:hypothetical protein